MNVLARGGATSGQSRSVVLGGSDHGNACSNPPLSFFAAPCCRRRRHGRALPGAAGPMRGATVRRDRPRYQVVLQLMPGAEPWMRCEVNGQEVTRMPATCSLLELWEVLSSGRRGAPTPRGEVMVRVPLELVLASPTIGEYRRSRKRQSD